MVSLLSAMKKEVMWKNALRATVLSQYSQLFSGLADICPCGVLPPKRTAVALVCCHKTRPINFSGKNDGDWADDTSALIRACFSKYRELANDIPARRRCYSKAFVNLYRATRVEQTRTKLPMHEAFPSYRFIYFIHVKIYIRCSFT